jgi:hypothetical protein
MPASIFLTMFHVPRPSTAILVRIWKSLWLPLRRNSFRKYCAGARSCAVRRRLMRQLHAEWGDETR